MVICQIVRRMKVVFIGDSGTGKTSIIRKYVDGQFVPTTPTIASACYTCTVKYEEKDCPVNIWDTAGQENYHSLASLYWRNAIVAVVVYDVTNEKSWVNVPRWIEEMNNNEPLAYIILVGNKIDLGDNRVICQDRADEYANQNNIIHIVTSSKTGYGIAILFGAIAQYLCENRADEISQTPTIVLPTAHTKTKKQCC